MDDLLFLGAGSAFNASLGNNSAFFRREEKLYLLDCGETVFSRLLLCGLLTPQTRVTVLLTHLHGDHCGSLASLCLYCCDILHCPATVVYPESEIREWLRVMGVGAEKYRHLTFLDEDGISAKAQSAHHGAMRAFSYELSADGERFFYSGDTAELPPTLLCDLASGRLGRAYLDAMDMRGGPAGCMHLSLGALAGVIPPALRPRCTLMHLNADYTRQANALGFDCATNHLYAKEAES